MGNDFEILMSFLSHSGSIKILYCLKNGAKRPKEIVEETKMDKTIVWRRVKELFKIGLIEVTIRHDTPTGTKAYQLSPLGRKIVKMLEQMEEEFTKYHLEEPREPEKFLKFKEEG